MTPPCLASQNAIDPYKVNSLVLGPDTDPVAGVVRWDPARSIWNASILAGALALGPLARYLLGNFEKVVLDFYRRRSEAP